MKLQTPASETGRRPGRIRPHPEQWRRAVAVRSTLLCAVLVCGAYALGHPSTVAHWLRGERGIESEEKVPLSTLVRQVEFAANAGQQAEVARLCATIVRQDPDHPVAEPAQVRLIQALIATGDADGVLRAFQEFRRRHPDSELLPEVLLDVAIWQYESGAYVPAAQTYTDLVALVTSSNIPHGSEDAAPSPIIIRSLERWKAHQRAERGRAELERLARFNQALCYEQAGERDAALRAYDRFVARFPQDVQAPEARFRGASLLLDQGLVEDALASFQGVYEDSAAAAKFRCESIYRAGRCLQSLRRTDAAVETYRRVRRLRPETDEFRLAALAELARLVEERDPSQALDIYRELAASSSEVGVRAVAVQRLAALEKDAPATSAPPH